MVSAFWSFAWRGEFIHCLCSFLVYWRQLPGKNHNLEFVAAMKTCLWDLSLQKVQLTNDPSCCALKCISTFMPKLFACPSQWLRMVETSRLSRRHRTTMMGNFDSKTLGNLVESFFTTALQSQMLPFNFPCFLFSFNPSYLQCFAFWWPSQSLRTHLLLFWVFLFSAKKKIFMFNLVLVSFTHITSRQT